MKSLRQIVELKKIDIVPDPELQSDSNAPPSRLDEIAQKENLNKRRDTILRR